MIGPWNGQTHTVFCWASAIFAQSEKTPQKWLKVQRDSISWKKRKVVQAMGYPKVLSSLRFVGIGKKGRRWKEEANKRLNKKKLSRILYDSFYPQVLHLTRSAFAFFKRLTNQERQPAKVLFQLSQKSEVGNWQEKIHLKALCDAPLVRTLSTMSPVWKMHGLMNTAQNSPHKNSSSTFLRNRVSASTWTTRAYSVRRHASSLFSACLKRACTPTRPR